MSLQLLALLTSVCYATALVSARRGLRYSTPATVTCFSVVVQVVTLWTVVFLMGGVPPVLAEAVLLFIFVGLSQLANATRRQGDKETRRQGDKETRRQGDKETRRQGDKERRRVRGRKG